MIHIPAQGRKSKAPTLNHLEPEISGCVEVEAEPSYGGFNLTYALKGVRTHETQSKPGCDQAKKRPPSARLCLHDYWYSRPGLLNRLHASRRQVVRLVG